MKKKPIHTLAILILLGSCASLEFDDQPISTSSEITRKVIITADDFGASDSIDEGILRALGDGIISSVDAMVTFPRAERALIELHESFPRISVGAHLSITSGYPVSEASDVPSLVSSGGSFYSIEQLMARVDRVDLGELRLELQAQVSEFERLGISIDHLSSQHNVLALYLPFFEILVEIAEEHALAVRSPLPLSAVDRRFRDAPTRQRGADIARYVAARRPAILFLLARDIGIKGMREKVYLLDEKELPHPDILVDVVWGQPSMETVLTVLEHLPAGTAEIVFHLGVHESDEDVPAGIDGNYYRMRELELACIRSPEFRRWLEILDIDIIGFGELSTPD
jgi:predicted glycoside hydrolase/deacetylase ChbG (UPF0249 family)